MLIDRYYSYGTSDGLVITQWAAESFNIEALVELFKVTKMQNSFRSSLQTINQESARKECDERIRDWNFKANISCLFRFINKYFLLLMRKVSFFEAFFTIVRVNNSNVRVNNANVKSK